MAQKFTEEEAYKIFNSHGLSPLERYVNCKQKIKCANKDGYFIDIKIIK